MTGSSSTYRVNVAGGLRVASGPLALVAANAAALVARGYQVWVRDPDQGVVAMHHRSGVLHISFHPGPGAVTTPPWMNRLSDLMAEISETPTNQERSNTP